MAELLEIADDSNPLIGQFATDGSQPESWTSDTLRASLARVNEHSLSARARTERVTSLISEVGQGDSILLELDTLDQVLGVLLTVSSAGMTSLDAIEPATSLVESSPGGLLSGGDRLIDIFDSFVEQSDVIAASVADLAEARRALDELVSTGDGRIVAHLSDFSELVGDMETGLRLVNGIAPFGRLILGADGVQRYLVLGQSADELRATGGFVSSVWLVTFQDGELREDGIKYEDAVSVDDWERLMLYPVAPPGLEEHMNAWVWLLRDVSWDPDFPTTARSAQDMYRIGQRQDVDGVVAINQWTLLRLVDALGGIDSPDGGEPITSRNLLSVLEQGTDRYGRAYMDLVVQGLLDKLNEPMSLPTLIRLASDLFDTLEERDALFFFNDPDVQALMSDLGWDGRVDQHSLDYLYVVDSNVGWSKVDRNMQRDITYVVDLRRAPWPRASLTLKYTNHSGPGSPGCEPQWLNRGTNYSQLKNACYWNLLRVYMPQGSRLLSSTSLPLPEYSVSVEIGRGLPGTDTGSISSSHDKMVFSGLDAVEAGERSEIGLVYDLPAPVLERDGGMLRYQLLIQKQPGVRQRGVSVEITPPDGHSLAASSLKPTRVDGSGVGFSVVLVQDTLLDVEFRRDVDDAG